MEYELIGVYPLESSKILKVERSELGIAVLGTGKLTNEELTAAIGCLGAEYRHRKELGQNTVKEAESIAGL